MIKQFTIACLFLISCTAISQNTIRLNDPVPDFKLWLLDGTRINQNDTKGKVIVFKFWFSSCIPCLTDIPSLNTLAKSFEGRDDVLFIAPSLDRKPVIDKLLKKHPFNFKIAFSASDVSTKFNVKAYPSYFIVDKKGYFSYIDSSVKMFKIENLERAIVAALKM